MREDCSLLAQCYIVSSCIGAVCSLSRNTLLLKLSNSSAVFCGLETLEILVELRSDGSLCVFRRRRVGWICVGSKTRMILML